MAEHIESLDTSGSCAGNEATPAKMSEADKLDASISEALIEYPNALVEFVGTDGLTKVLDRDVFAYRLGASFGDVKF